MPTTIDLDHLTLDKNAHNDRDEGVCLLEAVAWFAGEPHSDHPECVCPVLGAFGRGLNDALPDDRRQELVPLVPLLVGTHGDGYAERRAWMAADWQIRVYTPAFLDLAGIDTGLRDLPEIVDADTCRQAMGALTDAKQRAAAAGDAAWDAAGDAAGDAAWDAAWDAARAAAWAAAGDAARAAARAAAWDAAWAAARAAAWAAAGDAAWDAAWDAARAAAWAAAWDAAWAAAWDAAWAAAWDAAGDAAWAAARAAAWDAAWDKLQPTADVLQTSAIDLYRRMIGVK
jgi:hypothetical protein